MRFPLWVLIPLFIAYLFVNSLVFYSYSLGIAGNIYYFIRRPEKAMAYYQKAADKNTANVTALYNYAIELLHIGKAQEALVLLQRAQKFNTKPIYDKYIPLGISSCYWVLGDIDKAIHILEELKNKFDYVNVSTLTTLGYFYLLKGDYETAKDYTEQALSDTDNYAPAWDNMGQIYYRQQNYKQAEGAFLKALEYRASMVDSLYYMGMICELKGEHEQSQEYFIKASKCNISSMNTVTYEDIASKLDK